MADPFPRAEFDEDGDYYAITLVADPNGKTSSVGQTHWVGFADEEARIEIRELSLVKPTRMADCWEDFGQPYMVATDTRGFYRWFLGGGHALITREMTELHMPWELEPRECVQQGFYDGFTSVDDLPKGALNRAPTPKVRMQVLKRDGYGVVSVVGALRTTSMLSSMCTTFDHTRTAEFQPNQTSWRFAIRATTVSILTMSSISFH